MADFFHDRIDAGNRLAEKLLAYHARPNTMILALPRGGVPVAYPVAKRLKLPLDVFLVRKLGVPYPGHEELAMGAIALGGIKVFNQEVIQAMDIPEQLIEAEIIKEQQVLESRAVLYRGNKNPLNLTNKTVILIDDGIATGATILSAVKALHEKACKRIIMAIPVAPQSTLDKLSNEVNEIVCLRTPKDFFAIGSWYQDFSQTTDAEVQSLLHKSSQYKAD
ncbi:MAG: phosphoribosyltransferase [Pseudomonadota bacterium]